MMLSTLAAAVAALAVVCARAAPFTPDQFPSFGGLMELLPGFQAPPVCTSAADSDDCAACTTFCGSLTTCLATVRATQSLASANLGLLSLTNVPVPFFNGVSCAPFNIDVLPPSAGLPQGLPGAPPAAYAIPALSAPVTFSQENVTGVEDSTGVLTAQV